MAKGRTRKPLLSEEERAKQLKSREEQEHTCPLCGKYAEPGFSRMYCVTTTCKNFDLEVWTKKNSRKPAGYNDDQMWLSAVICPNTGKLSDEAKDAIFDWVWDADIVLHMDEVYEWIERYYAQYKRDRPLFGAGGQLEYLQDLCRSAAAGDRLLPPLFEEIWNRCPRT